jgi:hypothetical protein
VFLHLINHYDRTSYLPYDYSVTEHLAFAELNLLGKALISYGLYPNVVTAFLDKLFDLVENEALGLDEEESESL